MDIKTRIKSRIDKLSESEAKATLGWYAEKMELWLYCHDCPDMSACCASFKTDMPKMCIERIFDMALKEARK